MKMVISVKNCAFIGLDDKIAEVYGEEKIAFMKSCGMNTETVLTKEMLETNHYSATVLSRIESKIDGNLWCPILKKEISQ